MKTISVLDLQQLLSSGSSLALIDVRTPFEFRLRAVPSAINLPLNRITPSALAEHVAKDAPVYLICQTGVRSASAAERLTAYGYTETYSVAGGTKGWSNAGFPTHSNHQPLSNERRVMIAAGCLGVLGSVLAYAIHPGFIGIPALVGVGLAAAGLTNACGRLP